MKFILIVASVFITTLAMVSCKSSTATPIGALKAMGTASKGNDYKAIAKFMCKPDREAMEKIVVLVEEMSKKLGKDVKEMMKEKMGNNDQFNMANVEFKNEKITGDNATVDIYNKTKQSTQTVTMKKEDGTWKMCMGFAEKAKAEMGGESFEEGMKKAQEAIKGITPEQMKATQQAMKGITPEQMKATQEAMKDVMKNLTPEQIEKAKKMMEGMKK